MVATTHRFHSDFFFEPPPELPKGFDHVGGWILLSKSLDLRWGQREWVSTESSVLLLLRLVRDRLIFFVLFF